MNYYIVHFHADGGQMCVEGRRCLGNKEVAIGLLEILKAEPGHTCGPKSVHITSSEEPVPNIGYFDIDYNNPRSMNKQYAQKLRDYCTANNIPWSANE